MKPIPRFTFLSATLASQGANAKFANIDDAFKEGKAVNLANGIIRYTHSRKLSAALEDIRRVTEFITPVMGKYGRLCDLQGFYPQGGSLLVNDVPEVDIKENTKPDCWDETPVYDETLKGLTEVEGTRASAAGSVVRSRSAPRIEAKNSHPTATRWLRAGLLGLLALAAGAASAACPDGDPCKTAFFYRIQSWPMPIQDAAGRPMLSLREANAVDVAAFNATIKSMGGSTALAIRFSVTYMDMRPHDYCECNFERNGAGCHGGTPAAQLLQCQRQCRRGKDACRGSGWNAKEGGGNWYAFPDATQWTEGGRWSKNAFTVDARNRDWLERGRVIKRANCIARELNKGDPPSLDDLFNNNDLCPAIGEDELAKEAVK